MVRDNLLGFGFMRLPLVDEETAEFVIRETEPLVR
jgi:hypothetical protein